MMLNALREKPVRKSIYWAIAIHLILILAAMAIRISDHFKNPEEERHHFRVKAVDTRPLSMKSRKPGFQDPASKAGGADRNVVQFSIKSNEKSAKRDDLERILISDPDVLEPKKAGLEPTTTLEGRDLERIV